MTIKRNSRERKKKPTQYSHPTIPDLYLLPVSLQGIPPNVLIKLLGAKFPTVLARFSRGLSTNWWRCCCAQKAVCSAIRAFRWLAKACCIGNSMGIRGKPLTSPPFNRRLCWCNRFICEAWWKWCSTLEAPLVISAQSLAVRPICSGWSHAALASGMITTVPPSRRSNGIKNYNQKENTKIKMNIRKKCMFSGIAKWRRRVCSVEENSQQFQKERREEITGKLIWRPYFRSFKRDDSPCQEGGSNWFPIAYAMESPDLIRQGWADHTEQSVLYVNRERRWVRRDDMGGTVGHVTSQRWMTGRWSDPQDPPTSRQRISGHLHRL